MSTATKLHLQDFFGIEAENFFHARAYKRVLAAGIQHQDKVGEADHQAARKFLLLVKAAFHLAALGDIHYSAVIANHVAGGIAHRASGVQANDLAAILPRESNLAPLDHRLVVHLLPQGAALGFIGQQVREGAGEQVVLGLIAEHADERRVYINEVMVGSRNVDAFLQGLEELGKACFIVSSRNMACATQSK